MVSSNYSNYGGYGSSYSNLYANRQVPSHLYQDPNASSEPRSVGRSAVEPAAQQDSSKSGVGGFLKGIVGGAGKMISGLLTPQGLLMAGGAIALTAVCPPAGIALAGMGLLSGGSKMASGLASGDMEKAGEGFLDVGLSVAGGAAAKGASAGAKGASAASKGASTAAKAASTTKAGFFASAKSGASSALGKVKGWFGKKQPATPPTASGIPTPPPAPKLPVVKPGTNTVPNQLTPEGLQAAAGKLKHVEPKVTHNPVVIDKTSPGLWARGKETLSNAGTKAKNAFKEAPTQFKNAGGQMKNEFSAMRNPIEYGKTWASAKPRIARPDLGKNAGIWDKTKNFGHNVGDNMKANFHAAPVLTVGSGIALGHGAGQLLGGGEGESPFSLGG